MNVHEQWLASLDQFSDRLKELGLTPHLPAPSMVELDLYYLELEPGKKMVARLPFQKRFANPVGLYQGGFLAAGIDDVMGPLAYVTADRPCMTLALNVTYLRPFSEDMGHCLIEVQILQKTKTLIFMRAEVKSPKGDLMAHAESHVSILRDDQVKKA